jgi:hypothetical protein
MKSLSRLYYRLFKRYQRIECVFVQWAVADKLLRDNEGKPEHEQWTLAPEEDTNYVIGYIYLERRERILMKVNGVAITTKRA